MNKLKTYAVRLLCTVAVATVTASCDVHEVPLIIYGDVDYYLDLNYEGSMPLNQEVLYSRTSNSSAESDSRANVFKHDIRYIVNVYPADTSSKSRVTTGDAVKTFVFTDRTDVEKDRRLKLSLPEGSWDIYVWTDYIDNGSTADKYYNMSDWSSITYPSRDTYEGNNECREVFRGYTSVYVVHPYRFLDDEKLPSYTATVDMIRPLAKYKFISTDVDEFVERLNMMQSGSSRGNIDSRSLSRSDLEGFKVVFRYPTFMPSVYNMFTDRPTDSWTGMQFECQMDVTDEGILLGFDHVIVNGNESILNVAVDVYDSEGEKIASTPSINVPVVRGKYTNVKGEFLTSWSAGGVFIKPDFDGDYNIELK